MTDRELLELAAKVAGIEGEWMQDEDGGMPYLHNWENGCVFDPLTDDGDALRLAVKLNLWFRPMSFLCPDAHVVDVHIGGDGKLATERANGDSYAATRRAIVRAAAEIGKAMP